MREVQPSGLGLERRWALSVLRLFDRVIFARLDDLLVEHDGARDVVAQSPADAAARTRLDEAVLRTCVERVLTVHEARMQHDVSLLLRPRDEVGQSLPL